MRTTKRLALGLAVMMAMALTSGEAAAQLGGGAYGRISATARVIELVVPTAQLATVIAELVSDSTSSTRVLSSGVYLTVIEAPASDLISTTDIIAGSTADYLVSSRERFPVKIVLIEYPAN